MSLERAVNSVWNEVIISFLYVVHLSSTCRLNMGYHTQEYRCATCTHMYMYYAIIFSHISNAANSAW